MYSLEEVKIVDKEVYDTIISEKERQQNKIELIASENFVSKAVMASMGSVLTNKYAEGYPNKRYYGGCEEVDKTETLAIERAKALFGAEHANVQPHSGASANIAVYHALLKPNDTVLGMNLSHGGHLTHGSPVNFSGAMYNIIPYEVTKEDELIDYDVVRNLAIEHKPKLIIAGASAYSRFIDFAKFREIADECGAILMVDMAHIAGLVATGVHPSPVPYADIVTTTTHKTLRGPRGGMILCKKEYAQKIDKSIFPGTQGGPLMHVIAAKAVSFKEASTEEFVEYTKKVVNNASALSDELIKRGFDIVSGGTDNHLLTVKLVNKNITGKEAEHRLDEVGITCNKNTIPFDPNGPMVTSGIRLGTPAITTRGFTVTDMPELAELITLTIEQFEDKKDEIKQRVQNLLKKYPLYE